MGKRLSQFVLLLPLLTMFPALSLADSATVTNSCATLTLTSTEPAADGSYYIALDGTILSGYYYKAWLHVDGVQAAYGSSFWGTRYRTTKGPFTGEHLFKFTMEGGTSHSRCSSSVELKAGAKKDPAELSKELCATITALPEGAFKNNADQRKNALCSKLDEVALLAGYAADAEDAVIRGQFCTDAIEKLGNDIGDKMDGSLNGTTKNDWITDASAQKGLYPAVVEIQDLFRDLAE